MKTDVSVNFTFSSTVLVNLRKRLKKCDTVAGSDAGICLGSCFEVSGRTFIISGSDGSDATSTASLSDVGQSTLSRLLSGSGGVHPFTEKKLRDFMNSYEVEKPCKSGLFSDDLSDDLIDQKSESVISHLLLDLESKVESHVRSVQLRVCDLLPSVCSFEDMEQRLLEVESKLVNEIVFTIREHFDPLLGSQTKG